MDFEKFDPSRIRLPQDFDKVVGVKKALTTVPVRKPDRQSFIRAHQEEGWRIEVALLEFKGDRETYLIDPSIFHELPGEITPKVLVTAVDRQGNVFLWPIKLPGEDGRLDDWNRSALAAAEEATKRWVRVTANMAAGCYDVYIATGELPEPEWPVIEFKELLRLAFKDRYVDSLDHPAIRRLRGAV